MTTQKKNVPRKSRLSFDFPQVEAPDPTGGGQEQEMAGDNQVGGWKSGESTLELVNDSPRWHAKFVCECVVS